MPSGWGSQWGDHHDDCPEPGTIKMSLGDIPPKSPIFLDTFLKKKKKYMNLPSHNKVKVCYSNLECGRKKVGR